MNVQELNTWAERHPWTFSLGAGLCMGVIFAALFGANLLAVVAGAGHTLLQLGLAAGQRRRSRLAGASVEEARRRVDDHPAGQLGPHEDQRDEAVAGQDQEV